MWWRVIPELKIDRCVKRNNNLYSRSHRSMCLPNKWHKYPNVQLQQVLPCYRCKSKRLSRSIFFQVVVATSLPLKIEESAPLHAATRYKWGPSRICKNRNLEQSAFLVEPSDYCLYCGSRAGSNTNYNTPRKFIGRYFDPLLFK